MRLVWLLLLASSCVISDPSRAPVRPVEPEPFRLVPDHSAAIAEASARADSERWEREAAERSRKHDEDRRNAEARALVERCTAGREQRLSRRRSQLEELRRLREESAAREAYVQKHCARSTAPLYRRVPCDDGGEFVRLCNEQIGTTSIVTCPLDAPADIRGRHEYSLPWGSPSNADPSRVIRLGENDAPECAKLDADYERPSDAGVMYDGGRFDGRE